MKRYFSIILLMIIFSISCTVQSQKFDSEKWKSSGKFVRGSMIEDLKRSKVLQGKTTSEIEELLGKADENFSYSLDYDVITISRCYFWRCRMEISFNPQTKKAIGDIAVSD